MISEYEIPFEASVGVGRFSTTITGTPYDIRQRWNTRDAAWFFDIRESDLTPIALGLKVVLGAFIGRHINHTLFRRGVFVAHDTSGAKREAAFDDFGSRVIVKYIPALDIMRRLTELGR